MTRVAKLLSVCSTFLLLYIILVLEISITSAGSDCVAPVPLALFHHGDEDLTAAMNKIQCELGCIKQNGVTLVQLDAETGWPSLEFDSLNNNCPLYQKVHECKAGCLRRYSSPTLPINRCRDGCYTQCTNEQCSGEDSCQHEVDLICPRQCRKTYCKFGCLVHDAVEESITTNSQFLPGSPTSPPVLEHLAYSREGKWLYSVRTRAAIPTATSPVANNQTQYPIAYLLKISSTVKNTLRYVWQRNLSTPLDLSPFACSNVSISFAVISQLVSPRAVQFSPERTVSVPGLGGRPSQVIESSIGVHYTEDFRNGFFGYAVANITWDRPNSSEFLTSYKIRLYPDSENCGGALGTTYTYEDISKDTTYFVIQAGTDNGLMRFGCSYIIEMLAFPTNDLIGPYITSVSELSDPPPVMTLNCHRIWDASGQFNISLNWSFTDVAQISHITQFVVTPVTQNRVPIRNSLYLTRTEEWHDHFSVILNNFRPQVNGRQRLMIEVKSVLNSSYSWRDLPRTQSCKVKLSPIPPTSPKDILVRNILFNDTNNQLSFVAEWKPPTAAYGELTNYELFLGEEALEDNNGGVGNETFVQLFEATTTETEINRVFNVSEDTHCLQLQLRAYSNYSLSSEWTEPLTIPLDEDCRVAPNAAANVTNDNSSVSADSAEGNIAVYLERDQVGSVKLIELGCNSDSSLFGTSEGGISAQLSTLEERVDSVLHHVISNQQVEEKVVSLQEKLNNIEHKLDVLMNFVAQNTNQGS